MENAVETPAGMLIAGRYALHGELASGGMATVYLGHIVGSAGFSRPVAIKRLRAHFARDPEFVAMFLDEARLAARVRQANVVPTLDVVAMDGEVFLVMEYVHGEALSRLMSMVARSGDQVPLDVAVAIMVGLLEGLHAAHEAKSERGLPLNIVHRDVSPQNVLVGADGIARVFDFGVAKATGRMQTTRDGSLKGKVAYMSPEQLESSEVDRRTDLWASGVVLWELLTCKRLFAAESANELITEVLSSKVRRPTTLRECPASLEAVVMRALTRDPDQRFGTAREMISALEAALPPASPRAVAAWIERVAGDSLRAKAERVEEMERASGTDRPSKGTVRTKLAALGLGALEDRIAHDVTEVAVTKPAFEAEPEGATPGRVEAEPTGAAPGRVEEQPRPADDAGAAAERLLPKTGEILAGKYELGGCIGHGGMGIVFEAQHLRMHRRVAIKLLQPQLLEDRTAIARFDREARNASRLTSPHAARILDVDTTSSGIPFIVSEFLVGHDLERELKTRGVVPTAEAVTWILQACAAMAEAHALGIVHRDLKPSNLFLVGTAGSQTIKVLDFGISKAADGGDFDLTRTGALLGSPRYMAPEQIERARHVDERVDIWSLGVILFRALAGKHAFEGASTMEVTVAILNKPLPKLRDARPDLPRALCDAVAKALMRDPAERFATVKELARALEPFGADVLPTLPSSRDATRDDAHVSVRPAISAPPPPLASSRPPVASPQGPARRGVVLLVVGVLVVAALVLLGLRERDRPRTATPVALPESTQGAASAAVPDTAAADPSAPAGSAAPSPSSVMSAPSSAPGRHVPSRVRPADSSGKPRRKAPRPTSSSDQDPVFL